jgi:hypothetical protein
MSRYVVAIVQRDGVARYLMRGRLTDWQDHASKYPHPSNANQALDRFRARYPKLDCATYLCDLRDPERVLL